MANFDEAFKILIQHEGTTYHDDSKDRGGPTRYGITLGTLSRYRERGVSAFDVENLSLDEARQVYFKLYWKKMSLDKIQSYPVALCLFDQGVLRGVSAVVTDIQKLSGCVQDADLGPITAHALNLQDPKKLVLKFLLLQQTKYVQLVERHPEQLVFLEGWITRTHDLLISTLTPAPKQPHT